MNADQRFDVLLFDLGGVLIDFAGFDELTRFMSGSPGRAEIRDRWIHSKSVQVFERGDIDPQQFAVSVIAELEIDLEPERFLSELVGWARGPYPGAAPLMRRIKDGFRVACLSNSNELHTPLHRRAVEGIIETFFFSNEIGMVKPDREVFDHVVRELGVAASRIAFFDDTSINVEAAAQAGLKAFRVDGVVELEVVLERLGVFG